MINWKFQISNSTTNFEVKPFGKNTVISYKPIDIDFCYDYEIELKGDLTLIDEDFKRFLAIENSSSRCEKQTIKVLQKCNNSWKTRFTGYFTMSDVKWNLERCIATVSVNPINKYQCYEEFKDKEFNLFKLIIDRETIYYNECNLVRITNPSSNEYIYINNGVLCNGNGNDYIEIDPNGYIEICSRVAGYYEVKFGYYENGILVLTNFADFNLDVIGICGNSTNIDNGMKLKNVFESILTEICSELTIVSDFFQWNPSNPTTTNYVTNQLSNVLNLVLYQKSDVKRPNTSGNATKADINFEELIENIFTIFNLGFAIEEDNIFRIEHISYFNEQNGIDLSLIPESDFYLKGTRKYSYDKTKLAKYEKFSFMEQYNADFIGKNIEYDSECTNYNIDKKYEVNKITTDLEFIILNRDSDSEIISDNGFSLIACDLSNNVITVSGILEPASRLNNSLSWANLHKDFYKHGRILLVGNMNGNQTQFLSAIRTKKQDKFSVQFCCNTIDEFNPKELIKGTLGWGKIETAQFNLYNNLIELELIL